MIDVRPFGTLGHVDHGWLNARHHFSFASYHDPRRIGTAVEDAEVVLVDAR